MGSVSHGADRRRAKRYSKTSLVWFSVIDPASGESGIGVGFNISRGGVGFTSAQTLATGTRLLLHVRSRELTVTAVARVARTRTVGTAQHEVGVEILTLPPDQRSALDAAFP